MANQRPVQLENRPSTESGLQRAWWLLQEENACAFFTRTGACPHGTACKRRHVYPTESAVLVVLHLYRPEQRPPVARPLRSAGIADEVRAAVSGVEAGGGQRV